MTAKIGFLFGAGAERDFKIRSGVKFATGLLKKDQRVHKEIKEHYDNRIKNLNEIKKAWYPAHFQTSSFTEKSLLEKTVRKMKYEGHENPLVSSIGKSKNGFKEKTIEHKYLVKDELTEKGWKLVAEHPNYMGLLDERFHTLINPKSFGKRRFWSVLAIYTNAYLMIVRDILDIFKNSYTEKEILNDPVWAYREILRTIEEGAIYKKDSYYAAVAEITGGKAKVITTNYTPLAQKIMGIQNSQIACIHGKLSLFESAYRLQVYDVADKNFQEHFESDILFPYIFIQSGVKPVVEQRQLEEYGKTLDILKSIDEIVIVGYKINHDDNHLNSLLGSFALSGKKITYFAHDNPKCTKDDICGKLRLSGEDVKIEVIHIGKVDGVSKFRKYLKGKHGCGGL